ncbi:MAG: hypothetical protein K2X87_11190 [Gemmataceae bacterium]|nr:hypothetical protein [Gemmataceae bacterium]
MIGQAVSSPFQEGSACSPPSFAHSLTRSLAHSLARSLARCAILTRPFRVRKPATRRRPLAVEVLEGRDCPSTFWWTGQYGTSFTYPVGGNWKVGPDRYNLVPATSNPTQYDDINYDGAVVTNNANCQWGSGPNTVRSLHLVNGFSGTVQIGNLTVTDDLELRTGNISQGSSTTLTVQDDLTWTGGVLNSAANGATVVARGPTATITPGAGNTLQSGSRLSFEGAVNASISTGTLEFSSPRSIVVKGTSTVTVPNMVLRALTPSPDAIVLPAGDSQKFYADNAYADMGLYVAGGTAYMQGGGTVVFVGLVSSNPVATAVAVSGGALVIENGTTLAVGPTQRVYMTGGKLATKPVNAAAQPKATISGERLHVRGGEVVISDGSYAPGIVGHRYGELEVVGEVFWEKGVYKPTAGAPQNAVLSDLWHATGNFKIGDSDPRVEPISNSPALNTAYLIMSAGGVFQQATPPGVGPPPVFEPHTGTPLPSVLGNWEWAGAAFGDKNWSIEFLAD